MVKRPVLVAWVTALITGDERQRERAALADERRLAAGLRPSPVGGRNPAKLRKTVNASGYRCKRFCPGVLLVGLAVPLSLGCAPDLDDRLSIIERPTILAVQSEPAEGRPDTTVTYTALVAGPAGELRETADFAFCTERKPLAILGPVSPLCLQRTGNHLIPLGTGTTVSGRLPRAACRTFGPEAPPDSGGEPPRPFDPDDTGGYYQPVRVLELDGEREEYAVGRTRLDCGLAGASGDVSREHRQRYRANENPRIERVVSVDDAGDTELGEDAETAPHVRPGERLALRVEWESCPDTLGALGSGCGGSEPFLHFDLVDRRLVERFESLSLAWYATGGEFSRDRTGREAGDRAAFSENLWTAPSQPGEILLWMVIRDNRGGVGFRRAVVRVE